MLFNLVLLVLASIFAVGVSATSGYANTCWGCGLVEDEYSLWLECTCVTASAQLSYPSLDLQQCFVDNNGQLEYAVNGEFFAGCADYGLSGSARTVLIANCKDYNWNYQPTSIDMYDYIGNSDGQLTC